MAKTEKNEIPRGMRVCLGCGKLIGKNAKACPHCGEPKPRGVIFWIAASLIFLIGLALTAVNVYFMITARLYNWLYVTLGVFLMLAPWARR